MLSSGIVVLIAYCGFAAGAGEILVNVEKIEVINKDDNGIMGPWSASITEAKPMNKISMKTPTLIEMNESNLMLRLKASVDGSDLPVYESAACDAMDDEILGKGVIAAGNPFPDKCPAAKDNYEFKDFTPDQKKLPQGMPEGKLKGSLELYEPGKDPVVTINFEGTISRDMAG